MELDVHMAVRVSSVRRTTASSRVASAAYVQRCVYTYLLILSKCSSKLSQRAAFNAPSGNSWILSRKTSFNVSSEKDGVPSTNA